jgi:thiopurine S-methyltransferase
LQEEFWHQRWQEGKIGFHLNETNPNLTEWFDSLALEPGSRVFVPLCGKSLDMLWLAGQGMEVVGVEINELAVRGFFEENGLDPVIENRHNHDCWQAGNVTLIHADFFDIEQSDLGRIDAVYDRASLIALPPGLRVSYAEKIRQLLPAPVPVLLITLVYPQEQMQGPPFSVQHQEVESLYGQGYAISRLASIDILLNEPGFRKKGLDELTENVYLMR